VYVKEEEEEEENNDNDDSGSSVDNDDNKNNKNKFKEGSSGLDMNEVCNMHRDSKPNANKQVHTFIYDYYQVVAGVNHD
jgi:hypothetical protein